jgi:organic radical activating enzyme
MSNKISLLEKINKKKGLRENVLKASFSGKTVISQFSLEVCSSCQNNCQYCSHSAAIEYYKNYQLSIDELKTFIHYTKTSNYFIKTILVSGIGEPTLWSNFNEGIKILSQSGVVGEIIILSNGMSLDAISKDTFECIDIIWLTIYPHFKYQELLDSLVKKYPSKFIISPLDKFRESLKREYVNSVPCSCMCLGPMLIKDKIFYYCSPAVFGAAELKGVDIFNYKDMYTDVDKNYYKEYDVDNMNFELCKYCFVNRNINNQLLQHRHKNL